MQGVIVAVIGGVIGAGFVLDTQRQKARIEKNRLSLKADIGYDLERSVALYDELFREWKVADPNWLATLRQLQDSNPTYCNNQEWLGLFDQYGCKIQICDYYAASGQLFARIEHLYLDLHRSIEDGVDSAELEQAKTDLEAAVAQLENYRAMALELLHALGFEAVHAA